MTLWCCGCAAVGAVSGAVPAAAQRAEELVCPQLCRSEGLLLSLCPAGLLQLSPGSGGSPCLAEVRQNSSIVSRGLSAASQEQRIKCSSEEDN